MNKNSPADSSAISRRAVLRTTAWSIPAVAVAVAAPAAAASGGAAACLVYDGTDQLTFPVEAGSLPQPRLTSAATAAVAVWLEANSKGWPTDPSLFTATLTADCNVMLNGEQFGSFTVTGSSAGYSPVHQDGSTEGWGFIDQASQNATADFWEQISHYPSDATPEFIPGTSKVNAVLEFAYSAPCTLTATGTLPLG